MAIQEPLGDFLLGCYRAELKKPKLKMIVMLRKVSEDGWRPSVMSLEGVPLAIRHLIVSCCSHDPSARPSFEEIVWILNSKVTEEVTRGSFTRVVGMTDEQQTFAAGTARTSRLAGTTTESGETMAYPGPSAAAMIELGFIKEGASGALENSRMPERSIGTTSDQGIGTQI